jgi:hypothetical protein
VGALYQEQGGKKQRILCALVSSMTNRRKKKTKTKEADNLTMNPFFFFFFLLVFECLNPVLILRGEREKWDAFFCFLNSLVCLIDFKLQNSEISNATSPTRLPANTYTLATII